MYELESARPLDARRSASWIGLWTVLVSIVAIALWSWPQSSAADGHERFDARIAAAMEAPDRPAEDKARDANRLPRETLSFFEIDSASRVLELLPGKGWYTRLLAPALAEKGKLYLAFTQRTPKALLASEAMKDVVVLTPDAPFAPTERRGVFEVGPFEYGVEDLDAVLTFRNWHNLTPEARAHMNAAAYAALRPGGVFGVIDHTRRHNEPDSEKNWRRLDPVLVIEEVEAAGFDFEASSPIHYRPYDPLLEEVGHDSVAGKTDRFTLRFRKPLAN